MGQQDPRPILPGLPDILESGLQKAEAVAFAESLSQAVHGLADSNQDEVRRAKQSAGGTELAPELPDGGLPCNKRNGACKAETIPAANPCSENWLLRRLGDGSRSPCCNLITLWSCISSVTDVVIEARGSRQRCVCKHRPACHTCVPPMTALLGDLTFGFGKDLLGAMVLHGSIMANSWSDVRVEHPSGPRLRRACPT